MSSQPGFPASADDLVISARGISKCYALYDRPIDRLKQMLMRGRKKYFREYWALEPISFEVRKGQSVGILGRNGSGKSTLLQILAGTLLPTGGDCDVRGRVAAILQLGAGFNPEFTGYENAALAASILGLSKSEVEQRLPEIIAFAGLGDFIHQPVRAYSSGMYARLAFAVVAHVDADLLIIDEILAVGDAAFVQKCMRFIRDFKTKGTLLFVSHDIGAVLGLCDTAIWIENGSIRALGDAQDVCLQYQAAMVSETDDGARFKIGGHRKPAPQGRYQVDCRHEVLRSAGALGDVEIFEFDSDAPWFGHRGATILDVALLRGDGSRMAVVGGGEAVILEIKVRADEALDRPIVGFFAKDRLGQNIFGDNTFLQFRNTPLDLNAGQVAVARFHFQMPFLANGDYAIVAAVANGTQDNHVQHHWLDNALFFKVTHSFVSRGLVGLPMVAIEFSRF